MQNRFVQKLFVICLLALFNTNTNGQALKDHLAKADKAFQKKDFENALPSLLEALALDPDNAETNYKTGVAYYQLNNKKRAVEHLEKAYNIKPDVFPDIDYHLGMAYQYNHLYAQASKHFSAFKMRNKKLSAIADQKIIECSIGDSLMRHPANVEIKNFGTRVNSPFADFSPLVSADGNSLIFTSNRSSNDYQVKSSTNFEDIYVTHKEGGDWAEPQLISPTINTRHHEAAASLSHDGKTLFLYYEDGEGDIFTSVLENGNWTTPVQLNKFINNPLYRETSACLSPDGKKLYFSSNRPGGKGGFDIYVSKLEANGQWGRPSNLGSAINTRGDEESPFLHADSVTLYFSSNGHPNMGSSDLFRSELKHGKWTTPQNLGYPINSSGYDGFITVSADNTVGYFSAVREEGSGSTDIYSIRFLENPGTRATAGTTASGMNTTQGNFSGSGGTENPVITKLRGTVLDVKTSKPMVATVSLVDNTSNKLLSRITSDASGNFELNIPHGGNYGVTTEKSGYLFNSINFTVPAFAEYSEVDTHILMEKTEVGSKVVLKNIFFDVGKFDLKAESLSELANIRNLLKQNPGLRVQINGHTDNTGHEATNLVLSLKRAESVINHLIKEGVSRDQLAAKGFGSQKPLVSNDDESGGRQINRRTEIEIVQSGK
jgi:outer membrane protein OmpA-like peptidoglycan-associated protein